MMPKNRDEHEKIVDTILDEIHQTRRELAEKFGYDINAVLEDARERQKASGWPIWKGPARDESKQVNETSPPSSG
jgi:hypothetical protein